MVERIDFDDVDNSAIVSFKTRQDAEHVSHTISSYSKIHGLCR